MKRSVASPRRPRRRSRWIGVLAAGAIAGTAVPGLTLAQPLPAQAPLASQALTTQSVVGLGEGARGDAVKAVQTALVGKGITVPGGVDGIFGSGTRSAVTAFQSRNGLSPSGTVDNATAVALGLVAAAPSAAGGSLAEGATGDAVKALQSALMAAGIFVPGGADGVFGPATKTAVSSFQRWNGLTVTGVADATTAAKLKLGAAATTTPTAPATTAPAATPATSSVGLKVGARGDKVKALQQALIAAGISVRGGADGVFGTYTADALKAYQKAQGLSATGVVDATIVSKLGLDGVAATGSSTSTGTTTTVSSPYVGLKVGSTGDAVRALQRALMNTGLALVGGADGVFGNATRSTLIVFQRVNGFEQTGIVTGRDATALGLGTSASGTTSSGTTSGIATTAGYAVYGERGTRVVALQQALLKAGISFNGGADGIFGAATSNAILTYQRQQGLSQTGKVDDATAARLGLTAAAAPAAPSAAGVSIDVFPVQGMCSYADTFQAPRSGGRSHEGVDVIAAKGKLLYAVVTGTVSKIYTDYPGALAGNGLRVALPNGTYFTYLHLDSLAPGIDVGTKVTAGQVIGYVGETGNAGTPHLHFEVHPNGGAAVNPYSIIKAVDACKVTAPRG